jgi:hypothetical protein
LPGRTIAGVLLRRAELHRFVGHRLPCL